MLEYENKAKGKFRLVIGIDEAGRGPLAGPVVAAGVALKDFQFHNKICDSKKLNASGREKAFHEILDKAHVGIGVINETIIDSCNILQATYLAMNNAVRHLVVSETRRVSKRAQNSARACRRQESAYFVSNLSREENGIQPDKDILLLIDGNRFKTDLPYPYQTIVRGDSLSLSIACASIVAKVTRDRILKVYDQVFPQYEFSKHKGYPTVRHRQAIQKYGPSLIHRKTFHCV